MKNLLSCLLLLLLCSCERVDVPSELNENTTTPNPQHPTPTTPDPDDPREALLLTNDTARFYISRREVGYITLETMPDTHTDFQRYLSPYRMPTKSEAMALRKVTAPDGFWTTHQRILCYDETTLSDYDTSVIPTYYTFEFGGTSVTKAGTKTQYCVLGIRTEPLPRQDVGTTITINDQWE